MGVIRTWQCLNHRCDAQFDSWDPNPECPSCGCVRTSWVPNGGHIATVTGGADRELRTLADNFGLSDLRSAVRGEGSKRIAAQPVVDPRAAQATQFAPGFSAVAHPERAVCVPSSQKVNFRATASIGQSLGKSRSVPGVHAGTHIEASHRPPR